MRPWSTSSSRAKPPPDGPPAVRLRLPCRGALFPAAARGRSGGLSVSRSGLFRHGAARFFAFSGGERAVPSCAAFAARRRAGMQKPDSLRRGETVPGGGLQRRAFCKKKRFLRGKRFLRFLSDRYMPSRRGRNRVMSGKSMMTMSAMVAAPSMGSTGGVISSMVRLLIFAPTYRFTATGGVT